MTDTVTFSTQDKRRHVMAIICLLDVELFWLDMLLGQDDLPSIDDILSGEFTKYDLMVI